MFGTLVCVVTLDAHSLATHLENLNKFDYRKVKVNEWYSRIIMDIVVRDILATCFRELGLLEEELVERRTGEHYVNLYRNAAALLRRRLAKALLLDGVPSLDDLKDAVALLEEVDRTCEDLFDKSHGDAQVVKAELKKARAKLARARKAVARRAAATAALTAAGA